MRTLYRYLILFGFLTSIFAPQLLAQDTGGSVPSGEVQRTKPSNPPKVTATFEPDSIAIGDHFFLNIEVTHDAMQVVAFPEFKNQMMGEVIEILEELPIDTVERDRRTLTILKRYRLTTFEEGWYNAGVYPMLYLDKNIMDTIWSVDSMLLKVGTFDIDTATMDIHDIRRPIDAPMKFGEMSGYLIWGIVALAIVGALVWYLFTRRKGLTILGTPKPTVPPHVEAIQALESLHHQKLWQNNRYKIYYTGITDILRRYIERRYGIAAPDMITPDIIEALRGEEIPEHNFEKFVHILQVSDLVKFAKFTPEPDENEEIYTDAYFFVEATKPREVDEEDDRDEKEEDKKQ